MINNKNFIIIFALFFNVFISDVFSKESYKINNKGKKERIELKEMDLDSLFKESLESIVKLLPEKFTKNEENFFSTLDKKYHCLEPYFKNIHFRELPITKDAILKSFKDHRIFLKEEDENNIDEIFLEKYNLYLNYIEILKNLLNCYHQIKFYDNSDCTNEEERKRSLSHYNFIYSDDPDGDFLDNLKQIDENFPLIQIKNDQKYFEICYICFEKKFIKTLHWLAKEKKYIFQYDLSSIEFYNHIDFYAMESKNTRTPDFNNFLYNIFTKNNKDYGLFLKLLGCDDQKKHSKFLLHEAVRASNAELVKSLLQAGCNPNQKELNGVYPIFQAVANLDVETVSALLEHPVDLNVHLFDSCDNFIETTLLNLTINSSFYLLADRSYEFKDFFKYDATNQILTPYIPIFDKYNINENELYALELSALKIINLLLDKGIRLQSGIEQFAAKTWASYMWIKATFYQDKNTLEYLHAISLKDKSFAFDTYYFRDYKLLDKWKLYPFSDRFCSPLLISIWQNDLEITKLFLRQNNHFNRPEALHVAILMGHNDIVEALLDNDYIRKHCINKVLHCYKVVDDLHIDRATPLILALFKKNKKIKELLLRNGANPDLRIDDMNAAEFAEFFTKQSANSDEKKEETLFS
ncbi:MAG: ankyrin repeat domain-containing protein [Alphaproteobacteria bacterium]|nr:ankyrin repeat domain-containing protein [Alphaproteobacteria bacterium]